MPINSVKLSYSTGLFIHTVGGIVECVNTGSNSRTMNMSMNFSFCAQIFCSRVTNAVSFYENHAGLNEYNTEINALEADLDFTNPASMWDYEFYGINVSNDPFDKLHNLKAAINGIVTDFQLNCWQR